MKSRQEAGRGHPGSSWADCPAVAPGVGAALFLQRDSVLFLAHAPEPPCTPPPCSARGLTFGLAVQVVVRQPVAGSAAAAAPALFLQAIVRAAAVVHRAVGGAHLWTHKGGGRQGGAVTPCARPCSAVPHVPPPPPPPPPSGPQPAVRLCGPSPCMQKRPSQPRPQSQRKPPMPSMHVPWPQHGLSHGCSGSWTVHWSSSAT